MKKDKKKMKLKIEEEKKDKTEKLGLYISYGMCFGVLFGAILIEFFGFISVGIGMLLGVITGVLFYLFKKNDK